MQKLNVECFLSAIFAKKKSVFFPKPGKSIFVEHDYFQGEGGVLLTELI